MERVMIKHGDNEPEVGWSEIIDAAYHNLGDKAGKVVVHLAVDIKGACGFGGIQVDRETGLLQDAALYAEVREAYPQDDLEDLENFMFLRAFLFNEEDPEAIMEWSYEQFDCEEPSHIWINGKLCGGYNFPQSEDPDDFQPFVEVLSDYVTYRPQGH